MKIKILLGAMLLLFVTFSFAQSQTDTKLPVNERVKTTISELTPLLTLSNEQQTTLEGIYTDFYTGKDKLYEGLPPGSHPDKVKKDKLINDRDALIKTALNPDQYTKYREWDAQMMKNKKDIPIKQ